jgi:hypothetical protein
MVIVLATGTKVQAVKTSTASLTLRRNYCYRFWQLVKIHCPGPCFNPRTLGPMASTTTTRPPRTTVYKLHSSIVLLVSSVLLCIFTIFMNAVILYWRSYMLGTMFPKREFLRLSLLTEAVRIRLLKLHSLVFSHHPNYKWLFERGVIATTIPQATPTSP